MDLSIAPSFPQIRLGINKEPIAAARVKRYEEAEEKKDDIEVILHNPRDDLNLDPISLLYRVCELAKADKPLHFDVRRKVIQLCPRLKTAHLGKLSCTFGPTKDEGLFDAIMKTMKARPVRESSSSDLAKIIYGYAVCAAYIDLEPTKRLKSLRGALKEQTAYLVQYIEPTGEDEDSDRITFMRCAQATSFFVLPKLKDPFTKEIKSSGIVSDLQRDVGRFLMEAGFLEEYELGATYAYHAIDYYNPENHKGVEVDGKYHFSPSGKPTPDTILRNGILVNNGLHLHIISGRDWSKLKTDDSKLNYLKNCGIIN